MSQKHLPHRIKLRLHRFVVCAGCGLLFGRGFARLITLIGEEAKIVVRQVDLDQGQRVKYASAHDLRRGGAQRLINLGVSAETLNVLMRHADFATTEKFYGTTRSAPIGRDGSA